MKDKNKTKRVLGVLGIASLVLSLIAILVFVHSVGSTRVSARGDVAASAEKSRYTYLILGKDRVSGLTDVMMLASIDTEGKRAAVVQIPRDTYARYTDRDYKKLNGALSVLGEEGICRFVEDNMGVELDGYFVFGLDTFVKAIDTLGGVEMDVPDDIYYRDDAQGLVIELEKGTHRLDGKAAENFVRYRAHYLRGDIGRIDAQKLFISAFVKEVKRSLTPTKAIKLVSSLWGDIKTDVKLSELASLAVCLFDIDERSIELATLAGEEARSANSGAWYYVLSRSASERMLSELLLAKDREFDKNEIFRSIGNDSFDKIYFSDMQYETRNVYDIGENGIEIQKR